MKTLLACLSSPEHAGDVISACLPIARKHGSHLIGFHTLEALAVYPGVAGHVPLEVYTNFETSQNDEAEEIKKIFEERTRIEEFPCEWRLIKAASMTAADRIVEAAFAADLVVMAQADQSVDRADQYHAQEHVIRRSGRPVLHVPTGFKGEGLGKNVVLGWSPTREATRALHDALPLIQPGADVAIVTIGEGKDVGLEGETEIASALDRHKIKAEIVQRSASRGGIADELTAAALERGADLIVTGAFGHSRLYDFVIGAVTLDLMRNATLPVLFSR